MRDTGIEPLPTSSRLFLLTSRAYENECRRSGVVCRRTVGMLRRHRSCSSTGWNGPPNTGKRGAASLPVVGPHEWRHESGPTHRPSYFPRPEDERQIIRRKSFTLRRAQSTRPRFRWTCSTTIHLFTEKGTNTDSVLYRAGPTGYRLAQVNPASAQ